MFVMFFDGEGYLMKSEPTFYIKNIALVQGLIKWGEEELGHPAAIAVFSWFLADPSLSWCLCIRKKYRKDWWKYLEEIVTVCNPTVSKEVKKRKMKIRTVKLFPICQIFILLHRIKLSTRELVCFDMSTSYCNWTKNLTLLFWLIIK